MRWVIVLFLFFIYIINYADKAIVGYAAVPIMSDLNLTYAEWGLVGSSFYWLFSIGGIFGAALIDKFGTKKLLIVMAIAWTVAQFSAFAIQGLTLLVITRVILGAFEGPYLATAVNQISKWFPPERRAFALSLANCGSMGAKVIAPLLILIVHTYSWRIAFGFLGTLSLIWVILWTIFGKEQPKKQKISEVSKNELPKIKWSVLIKRLMKKDFIFTILAFFSAFWILSWSFVWMPIYLTEIIHLSPTYMGYTVAGIGIFTSVGSVLAAMLSDYVLRKTKSHRKSRVFVAGYALILASIALYLTTVVHSIVGAVIALAFGVMLVNTVFSIAPQIANQLLPERPGLASGTLIGLANLAGIIGPLVTGWVVQLANGNTTLGFNYSITVGASVVFVFSLLFIIFTNPDRTSVKENHLIIKQPSIKKLSSQKQ
ncbi:MFS transporter [Bacillus massiliigorillae]|uniref:MFS transporter n=1 Tax=Bacillus massiliigorillae TaxID=1243664 RepID=UPI0003A2B068|nr:MFS transporter [Bacillus massiliigorillae]